LCFCFKCVRGEWRGGDGEKRLVTWVPSSISLLCVHRGGKGQTRPKKRRPFTGCRVLSLMPIHSGRPTRKSWKFALLQQRNKKGLGPTEFGKGASAWGDHSAQAPLLGGDSSGSGWGGVYGKQKSAKGRNKSRPELIAKGGGGHGNGDRWERSEKREQPGEKWRTQELGALFSRAFDRFDGGGPQQGVTGTW